jgi:uncharacterized protein YjbI with pentapeptide repeats
VAKPEEEPRRFDEAQYNRLLRCSSAGNPSEWNAWREANPSQAVELDGAQLDEANLDGMNLEDAFLRGASLNEASLRKASLNGARMSRAQAYKARFDGATLATADIRDADLREAHLGCHMMLTDVRGANLWSAHLGGAMLRFAKLQGANFSHAIIDGTTNIDSCEIDKRTDFTAAGLRSARIEGPLRSRLEGNVRRLAWGRMYGSRSGSVLPVRLAWHVLCLPVRLFWAASDYGQSTMRILMSFLLVTVLFAVLYAEVPGLAKNLHQIDGEAVSAEVLPYRAAYFSVVTMTTLGFGDIYANPRGIAGHVALSLQVLTGYVLLAALVTRLAVLFQES